MQIDRQLASDLGVRVSDVASAVRLLMSGEDEISTFKERVEQYPVTMRLMPGQRDDPEVLSRLLVPSARLGLIRLDSIAQLERGLGPSRIDRFARQFGIGFYGNVAPGHSLGRGRRGRRSASSTESDLPPGYSLVFSGQVKILEETTTNMILAIGLASIFMYMVLAAQFESLVHPFIILLTLPLSIPFALLSLIAHRPLAEPVQRPRRAAAAGHREEERHSADRLHEPAAGPGHAAARGDSGGQPRPAAAHSDDDVLDHRRPDPHRYRHRAPGAATRSAIAVTIIGGQTLCLLLTLLVVPVAYAYVEDAKAWLARRRHTHVQMPAVGD